MRLIAASKFKAHCLAILDDVARTGEPITITKRGRPVARLGPAVTTEEAFPQDSLRDSVEILGDILAPAVPAEEWDAVRGNVHESDLG